MFNLFAINKLTVLVFHKVPEEGNPLVPDEMIRRQFEKVINFVDNLFFVIPLSHAVLALRAGNLPRRAACITFDDGYPEWITGVVPVLQRYNMPATFFITTGQFNNRPMWNERILYAITHAKSGSEGVDLKDVGLPWLPLSSMFDRVRVINQLVRVLKYVDSDRRENYIQQLERQLDVSNSDVPVLTPMQVRDLHARGFEIGGHTISHPILNCCDPSRAFHEIAGVKEELEGIINGRVESFAYPNGIPGRDFGVEHIEMIKKAGYTCAVTTHHGTATSGTSLYQIPRFTPWGPSVYKMRLQVMRNFMIARSELSENKPSGRRALMVAFHFPPQAGSSGVLRTLNFVKNLPSKGWLPTVLTAQPHAYVEQRNDLVKLIPTYVRVERANALDAARHLSIKGKYPSFFALPDRWSTWWIFAVLKGLREIREYHPALIWSTYPISTAHLIGATLARMSGLPWVADFRDPMVSDGYPSNLIQRRCWRWLESYVLQHASACVFTTARAAATYSQRYPAASGRCHVIENGYDEEAFADARPNRFGMSNDKLLLLHSGLIYPEDRNPSTFFAAIRTLLDAGCLLRDRLCIRFRAAHHDAEVRAYAEQYGLQDIVELAPPVPYHQAITEMMGADLLLVFQGSHFNAQIPAKIYEYLRAGRPVFAVVDPQGDTATALHEFPAVYVADIASEADIQCCLQGAIDVLGAGGLTEALHENQVLVRRYARKAQADRLVLQLDAIAALAQDER